MDVFDYIEKELDRIEVGYTSYDGTKITLTMDEVRELVQNIKKKYQPDGNVIYRSDAIDVLDKRFDSIPIEQTAEILQLRRDLRELPSAQPEPQWIPCHDPSDLPKDKRIWITREYEVYGFRDVSNVIWDMTEWSDNVSGVVAYMPYIEPEPYTERREE